MAQISNILIPCFCVQMNNQQFISDTGVIGKVLNVPCKEMLLEEDLYWCTPVSDCGIFSQLQYRLAVGVNANAPTFDSFLVQRIKDKLSNYTWWIYVTSSSDFANSANTVSSQSNIPMPGTTPGSFIPVIAACQVLCAISHSNPAIGGVYGLPVPAGAQKYFAFGSYNNIALSNSSTGFSALADLLTYLNTNWTNIGNPATSFIWTASADNLTLFATGGFSGDALCVNVYAQ